ncbi:MAG TPA: helix-turn-helix domain-containing protein [Rhizomicrobium sp.]|jgi:AcrR family transcriptional regulator
MVRQSERREATIGAILKAARKLFAAQGFDAASIDDIAAEAGVAKGAVYHHFESKEELFTQVLEGVQEELARAPVPATAMKISDPLDQISGAVLRYLLAANAAGVRQILLIDGPAVIGWEKWREIDDRFFAAGAKLAITHVLKGAASQARIDALTHLFMGAVMEACLVCARSEAPRKSARELAAALRMMLEGLRHN